MDEAYVPLLHLEHTISAPGLNSPILHCVHCGEVIPTAGEYVPPAHGEQADIALVVAYKPAAQEVHAEVAEMAELYLPTSHDWHHWTLWLDDSRYGTFSGPRPAWLHE